MARAENKSTAKVYAGVVYGEAESFSLSNQIKWEQWLCGNRTFYFECPDGTFTARREERNDMTWFWYAYRKHNKKLYKMYLGKVGDLTEAHMKQIANRLRIKSGAT